MTPQEHYDEAQRLLGLVKARADLEHEVIVEWTARAQVHATLATVPQASYLADL